MRGLVFLLVACASVDASADWAVGSGVGAGAAYGSTEPSSEGAPRLGFSLGAVLEHRWRSGFAVRLGVRYTQKGAKAEVFELLGLRVTGTLELDYAEAALTGVYRWSMGDWGLYALGGVSGGWATTREFQMDSFSFIRPQIDQRFTSHDVALDGGGGVFLGLGDRGEIMLGPRVSYGLLDLDRQNDYRSRVVQVVLTALYRL